jgi:hypothetical protein
MQLSKTTVGIPLAGLLLIGAAGAVAATTGEPAPDTAITLAAPSATPAPSAGTTVTPVAKQDTVLSDVLDGLVAKGTITAAQQTAIEDAVAAERTARQQARQAAREQLQGFLADGVITKAEFDQLPADSPLRTATTLMDDGQITTQELQSLGHGFGLGRGGHGHGPHDATDDDTTPAPTPSPSAGTSG